ncbi:MAG: hypothetical protein D6791_04565 [Chloroflexi bacterium]|nr:MAG: hypothetical protein D6791_04565 [Chloroflexota bacterium]
MNTATLSDGMNAFSFPLPVSTSLGKGEVVARQESLTRGNGKRPFVAEDVKPLLRLRLLGTFQASLADAPLSGLRSDKARALLAYLAIESDRPHRRESLAALFWGDYNPAAAKASLRQTLSNLRQVLAPLGTATGNPTLDITRHTVQFNIDSRKTWIDVHAFTAHLAAGRIGSGDGQGDHAVDIYQLERAVELYRGDFLTGLELDDCPEFEQWRLIQQEEYHRQMLAALEVITAHYLTRGDAVKAQKYARRQLAIEPWHEPGHRQLMEALALAGQRGAALQQFETCTHILAEELGVEPSAETVDLYQRIRSGENTMSPQPYYPRPSHLNVPLPPSPYPGLYPYTTREAALFSGQNEVIAQLETTLRRHSFVTLTGPSGSGKSSLVAAGLLPRLTRADEVQKASSHDEPSWVVTTVQPGKHPLLALAEALIPYLEPQLSATDRLIQAHKLADAFKAREISLSTVLHRIQRTSTHGHGQGRLLLVVDPLDDIFRHCESESERQTFLDLLLEAGDQPRTGRGGTYPCSVLVVLRSDYLAQARAYPPLAQALESALFRLPPLSREALREAVELPALKRKIGFEPGLASRIVDEIGTSPTPLPLAQLVLSTLWKRQGTGPRLTHAVYDEAGRLGGVLSEHAEQCLAEMSPAEQDLAKQVLLEMVHIEEHVEPTVRTIRREEMSEEGWRMVQLLADARLVCLGCDDEDPQTATLIHASLLTHWQRLREWIAEERDFCLWRNRFRALVWHWLAGERQTSGLLRGSQLAEARQWMAQRSAVFSPDEQAFIQASIAQQEKSGQQKREVSSPSFWQSLQRLDLAEVRRGLMVSALVAMTGMLVYAAAASLVPM